MDSIKKDIITLAEDAESIAGCSCGDVLQDGLRDIAKDLRKLAKKIEKDAKESESDLLTVYLLGRSSR